MSAISEALHSPLFRRALLEAVLVGALLGAVGVHVALRRMSFFVVALSHGTFPGVVAASLVGVSLFTGGLAAAALMILAIVAVGRAREIDESGAVGIVLAGAFAIGVVLLSAQAGQSRDLSAFLVGQVLSVTRADLIRTVLVGVGLLAVLGGLHKELVASAFDETGVTALGYSAIRLDVIAMAAIAVALVTAIPVVGTILAVSLLTVPALAARELSERTGALFGLAAGIGALSGALGMFASVLANVSAGPAIALAAVALFVTCVTARGVGRHFVTKEAPVPLTA